MWREANAEHLRESFKQQYIKANRVEYFAAWRDANREKVRAISAKYKKSAAPKVAARNAKRHAQKINATPLWADLNAIDAIYEDASDFRAVGIDVEVDHIVPLKSKFVSGLHVPTNLRVILTEHNRAKGNRIWPDMP